MVRVGIIGIVIAVAFILYALVDAAMADASRARGVPKPVWVVLIVVLPVLGAVLWFAIGKGKAGAEPRRTVAPDDDPRFTGKRLNDTELDEHFRELEDRLRELDSETFPGEGGKSAASDSDPAVNDPDTTEPVNGDDKPEAK